MKKLTYANSDLLCSYKVAIAMPSLDELLKDTPTHEFLLSGLSGERQFYPTHYSELIRLAALYYRPERSSKWNQGLEPKIGKLSGEENKMTRYRSYENLEPRIGTQTSSSEENKMIRRRPYDNMEPMIGTRTSSVKDNKVNLSYASRNGNSYNPFDTPLENSIENVDRSKELWQYNPQNYLRLGI
ncbi:hypothetical protein Tco_0209350 [Tanacetum coccineum]